ncbi:transposable element P transposase [Leptinotarsa decemlineata]|uniref:transposable element P transposase n=1 Tax=Leptinotarsa decemlineata TaxID=7539 RepID=UPI003D30D1DD
MKDAREKVCLLMFDEMSIDTNLFYQRQDDEIMGFQDYGTERHPVLANHANVFMLKGVYKQWKQPVVFTFSNGPIEVLQLKKLIKDIIKECFIIGLNVIATVCDQGTTNASAINMLLQETKEVFLRSNTENLYFGFLVDNHEVVPLYDVPHLLKGLRNNLINKNLHYTQNGIEKVAKWNHIEKFYQLDSSEPSLRMCYKLTDAHIYKSKMNKMKVKTCTQVFSYTIGSLMKRIAHWDIKDNHSLPAEAEHTADLILFLDELFDSLNVSRKSKPEAKRLKCALTSNSGHSKFWKEALPLITRMRYFSLQKNKFILPPTLKNLHFTLRGFLYLKNIPLTKFDFKYILTAAFNQDALENFFSYIRSHGVRNTKPDVSHFISSFKTLLANNFMSAHSPGSNCERDMSTRALDDLRSFLCGEYVAGVHPLDYSTLLVPGIPDNLHIGKTKLARCTLKYMSGSIGRILLKSKIINNCDDCKRNILFRYNSESDDDFIDARQYERGHLIRPGQCLNFLVSQSLNYLFYIIPRLGTAKNISICLENILTNKLYFQPLNCPQHDTGKKLYQIIIRCSLFWWTKSVNKIAKGIDTKFSKFLSKNPPKAYIDPIKVHDRRTFEKNKKRKN